MLAHVSLPQADIRVRRPLRPCRPHYSGGRSRTEMSRYNSRESGVFKLQSVCDARIFVTQA